MKIRGSGKQNVRLDLTPLIDVVFLLLIFFMVSTTFDRQTILKVALPEASEQAVQEEQQREEIFITIDEQGRFYINDEELITHDLDTLKRAMTKAADNRTDIPVLVSSDKQAPFQSAITVMDAVGQLGFSKLSFIARQTNE